MKKFARIAVLGLLAASAVTLPAQAQVAVDFTGTHGITEGACTQINKLFGTFDCTYGGTNLVGTPGGWSGPSLGGSYYAAGSVGDSTAYAPVPGDGKLAPTITGQFVITGTGGTATVAGTIIVGPAVRNIATGQATRAVQRWTSITHTLAATPVSTAVANGAGGFDYVIGSRGVPAQICLAGGGACFGLHESGADTVAGPVNSWGVAGVAGTKPAVGITSMEWVAGAGATGTTDQTNVGATTTGVIAGASCESNDTTVPLDCIAGATLWGIGEDAGFDNLIMAFSTNAAGDITSGRAYWTQDYYIDLAGGPFDTNSDSSGTFTFTGTAAGPLPACADFAAGVDQNSSNNAIAALAQCTNFGAAVTITIVTPPTNGTASVSGANNIIYTPNAGFSGADTITYNGSDGTDNDDGVLTITVAVPNDTTPDAFSFVAVTDQAVSTLVVSNAITVAGITAASPITVTGGEYSINDGPFTAVAGSVVAGNSVKARLTTSASPSTASSATVTIGGVSDTFTATTAAAVPDTKPDQFTFDDQDGVDRDTVIISDPVTITGINAPAAIAVSGPGGEYSVGCTGTFTSLEGTITNGQTVCVRHTSAATSGTAVTTTLTVGTAPNTTVDAFSSATRRAGGSSSMDGLALGMLGVIALFRRRRTGPALKRGWS